MNFYLELFFSSPEKSRKKTVKGKKKKTNKWQPKKSQTPAI
jgi:hypothetical protein